MIVVDTSVWIDHFRNNSTAEVRRLLTHVEPDEVLVGDLVLLELLPRARDEAHAYSIRTELSQFQRTAMLSENVAV